MQTLPSFLTAVRRQWPEFASAMVEFQCLPAAYAHPNRMESLFPTLPARVRISPRFRDRLSHLLLESSGLSDVYCATLPHPEWPLALLPTARLGRLARHVGALAIGAHVRSSLAREQVLTWKERLGGDAYRFAMNSASLLSIGKLPSLDASDPAGIGCDFLRLRSEAMPEGMRERFLLKLPETAGALNLEADVVHRLVQTALHVIEGEWCSYCGPISH